MVCNVCNRVPYLRSQAPVRTAGSLCEQNERVAVLQLMGENGEKGGERRRKLGRHEEKKRNK